MSNSIITAAGAALIAACQANEEILVIDKMIFADVPDLDTGVMPSADTVLPPSGQIKLQADIVQAGLVNSNTIVYSVTLGATAGPFYINWIGLYSSAHNTLVAVCYVPRHYKFATDGFRTGNTLYKNFALQIANVSELTGVIISAGTWQQDLTAILANYALAHTHPYEPIGAVATHNSEANAHSGMFIKSGSVIALASSAVPNGYLECNGASLDRSVYAGLFAVIGTIYGSADGTHFNLPDYRGKFLRGWDHGAGHDPDAATRSNRGDGTSGDVVGSKQGDKFTLVYDGSNPVGSAVYDARGWFATPYMGAEAHQVSYSLSGSRDFSGNDTRPVNVNIMYCIKY